MLNSYQFHFHCIVCGEKMDSGPLPWPHFSWLHICPGRLVWIQKMFDLMGIKDG